MTRSTSRSITCSLTRLARCFSHITSRSMSTPRVSIPSKACCMRARFWSSRALRRVSMTAGLTREASSRSVWAKPNQRMRAPLARAMSTARCRARSLPSPLGSAMARMVRRSFMLEASCGGRGATGERGSTDSRSVDGWQYNRRGRSNGSSRAGNLPPRSQSIIQFQVRHGEPRMAWVLRLLLWFSLATLPDGVHAEGGFDLEQVVDRARQLAAERHVPPAPVPRFLRELDYDAWRNIRFDPEQSLWREDGGPFQVMLVLPGLYYWHPVSLNVVEQGEVRPVPFARGQYLFADRALERRVPSDLGHAGFTLTHPLSGRIGEYNQFLVFAGASYFRAVGRDSHFGLSARGLAVDTGLPRGEQFPAFTTFWLVRPEPGAHSMVVYALLEGEQVTGAYRFDVTPGDPTLIGVQAVLFPRRAIELPGLAPLTSMFFHGRHTPRPRGEWRPQVHDSDGLLMRDADSGEWLWRDREGEQVTGAYRFDVTPGAPTLIGVQAVLFPRRAIELPGLAPLTSMFFHGRHTPRPRGEWRPQVHDSDGLLMRDADSGEWLWRPLINPEVLTQDFFEVGELSGFGLLQRDREFTSYQDLEAHYHRRPSAWVTPVGRWGAGRVVLTQLPTPVETHDTCVAHMLPASLPAHG